MRTIEITFPLYLYSELGDKVQDRVLNDLVKAWLANDWLVPEHALPRFKKAVQKSFEMQTPWFAAEIVYDACKTYIEDELDRWYFEADGTNYDYIENVEDEYGEEIENEQVER